MHSYNQTFYYNGTLKKEAKKYLEALPKSVTVLVTMGASGCAIASAMMSLSKRDLYHCHLRKDGEKSHSTYRAGYTPTENDNIAIVDDFINTGDTINKITTKLNEYPFKSEFRKINKKQIKIIIVDDCDKPFREVAKRIKIKCVGRKKK